MTAAQKHEICLDYFSAQLYLARELGGQKVENEMISEIDDVELRTGSEKPQHALIVDKVGLTISAELILNKSDIFFKCVGRSINFDLRSPHHFGVYYISYAFRFGLFFDNFLESRYQHDPSMNIMNQMRYFSMSPEYVALQPDDLENQYLQTRRTMRKFLHNSGAPIALGSLQLEKIIESLGFLEILIFKIILQALYELKVHLRVHTFSILLNES